MHVTNGYKCYLFVIKSFCVANLCGFSQPQKYFNNKLKVWYNEYAQWYKANT